MNCLNIKKLQCLNFRNLKDQIFEFSSGINCILGENGNGKTNLLECIFIITNKRSFRKNTGFSQLLNIEGERNEIIILSTFEDKNGLQSYSIKLTQEGEERYLNNRATKKSLTKSVFINPFDSYQFHISSTFRRQWMDSHLSLINEDYKKYLNRFQKALKFRNSLLAFRSREALAQLKAIDEQIAEYSQIMTQYRILFLKDLNFVISHTFKKIFSQEHQLELDLESSFKNWDKSKIYDFYRHSEEKDIKAGLTQVGIHRDDYIFSFDGLNAFEFCSLGQQKMSFLSLIFAYIEVFRYKFESYPLVLIDDVSGELDSQRWKNLIEYLEIKQFQVLITTANENFGKELEKIPDSKKFYIEHGKLI